MKIGAHVSVKGGLPKAFDWVDRYGCESVQIFTKSQLQWAARPLSADEIRSFRSAWEARGNIPAVVHNSYLINLASLDEPLWEKSVAAMALELERAAELGIPWVVTHPGSPRDAGEDAGICACAAALCEVLARTEQLPTGILLETTAGTGNMLGGRFEQLGELIQRAENPSRTGVCFDTCHVFAAGYDFRTADGYAAVMDEFERHVGLEFLRAFHLNDSKTPLGSRRDRHAEPGCGEIGAEGFRHFMRDARFAEHPGITELADTLTPRAIGLLKGMKEEPRTANDER